MIDPLSEALGLLHARVNARGLIAGGRWALRFHSGPHRLNVHAVVGGSCRLILGGQEPLSLSEGEVVLSHGATSCVLASNDTIVAGGPTVTAGMPAAGASDATIAAGLPTVSAGHRRVRAGIPTHSASHPTVSAGIPTLSTSDPTVSAGIPAPSGSDPTVSAGDRSVLAGIPTVSASDPSVLTGDPAVSARDAEEVFATDPSPILRFGGDDVVGIVGHIWLDQSTFLGALPSVTRITAAGLLDQAFHELSHPGPGSDFASERYAQLILLEVLRRNTPPTGWLRVQTDTELHPALALMHAHPAHPWRLADLAHAVSMSRSTFATRFRTLSGMPPLTYLHHWRIGLAQAALRDTDATVATLAARFGYASESSFSHAFSRTAGVSPRHYRALYRA